jgi:cytochrome c
MSSEARRAKVPSMKLVRFGPFLLIGLVALAAAVGPGIAAGDAAAGKMLYEAKCGGCHSVDRNRIGPLHRGVVGRPVASVPGYSYSPALRKLGGSWTAARLDRWLSGTQRMAPGSKMYLEIDDPAQRRAIIAYLGSVSKPPRR